MYRQLSKTAIARQTASRLAKSYSTNASTSSSSKLNSKLLAGAIVPIAAAVGYMSFSNSISNETVLGVADKLRKTFEEGDALGIEQQDKFADEQQRLKSEKEDKELAKIEKQKGINTKNAGGLDSTDPASDSKTRDVASKQLDDDTSRHEASDPKNVEKSKEIRQDIKENFHPEGKAQKKPTKNEGSDGETAYNPETGEINWDCPCLGGMAQGSCGEEFKEAFTCFIFSDAEPKGIDCVKKFETMRTCFKKHPDEYKEELYNGDDENNTEVVEHVVLEVAEPAVKEIEEGLDSGKLKPKK
ncbi:MIA40 [Candida margitis]|uniref:MIA40 n=1 Tax=Candida margitis TaxID=1775924 RepID=UPI0022280AEF|nr:MIA40 [Candida margitis]KAI5949662.1 MIA40 [Candida margitis]